MNTLRLAGAALLLLGVAACGQRPAGGSAVVILNVSEVARATGEDAIIRQRAEAGQQEVILQLQQLAQELEANLAAEEEKAGIAPSEADARRLLQLEQDARQQVGQAQQQAQAQVQQLQADLVMEFRDALLPIARRLAEERGASLVLTQDGNVFWAADGVDITADVIAAWQAQPGAAEEAAAEPAAAVPAEVEPQAAESAEPAAAE